MCMQSLFVLEALQTVSSDHFSVSDGSTMPEDALVITKLCFLQCIYYFLLVISEIVFSDLSNISYFSNQNLTLDWTKNMNSFSTSSTTLLYQKDIGLQFSFRK